LTAPVVITVSPTILFFIIMQKQVIGSLTEGAVKG
jgi:ABC-type glycerol-3-phosphate transport system permease component